MGGISRKRAEGELNELLSTLETYDQVPFSGKVEELVGKAVDKFESGEYDSAFRISSNILGKLKEGTDKVKELISKPEKLEEETEKPKNSDNNLSTLTSRQSDSREGDYPPSYPELHGPLTRFEGLSGFTEVERYWIEEPYSLVVILREEDTNYYRYQLCEPPLLPSEEELLEKIWNTLNDILPYEVEVETKKELLLEELEKITEEYEIISPETLYKFAYYLIRDRIGYGTINALLKDPKIEDIFCTGPKKPMYIYHRDYGEMETNLTFPKENLDEYIMLLAKEAGSDISYANPIMESRLPEGSRISATLGSRVTPHGSSFTIRKFWAAFSPSDLIRVGTFNPRMLAYLWLAVENEKSIMVAGPAASGKTTTLNALGFFIPPNARIVSIEDTRELSFYQENWLPMLTSEEGTKSVDMFELVERAVRQRPEYLVVGEVRGAEAQALFQGISMGHQGLMTMHAESARGLLNRLLGEPMNVPWRMLSELDIVCFQTLTELEEENVRRNRRISEVLGLDQEREEVRRKYVYRWDRESDSFEKMEDSTILRDIGRKLGLRPAEVGWELDRREMILEHLAKKPDLTATQVVSFIQRYYSEPDKILKEVF